MNLKAAMLIATAAACLLAGGCSDSSPPAPDGTENVSVVERDFSIKAPEHIGFGPVRFTVENRGPDAHEFILLRADPSGLPLRADGLTVDEDAVETRTVAALEPGLPGVRDLDVDLTPGRYLMICNMNGHLMGGMKRALVVG
jgi:uncharacterized cupredoxin-like copper-binding protein